MELTTAEMLGVIKIVVYKTSDGDNFFEIKEENGDLYPVADVIEDLLIKY